MFNGQTEGIDHRLMELRDACSGQSGGVRERMNAGREQNLIDVNIAQPGEERLIQQQRFDARLSFSETRRKWSEAHFERLGPQLTYARIAPFDPPELARIVVEQDAVVEREDSIGVGRPGAAGEELPGHAEMHDEMTLVERDYNELAPARDRFNPPSGNA